jgi:hypothetical protein
MFSASVGAERETSCDCKASRAEVEALSVDGVGCGSVVEGVVVCVGPEIGAGLGVDGAGAGGGGSVTGGFTVDGIGGSVGEEVVVFAGVTEGVVVTGFGKETVGEDAGTDGKETVPAEDVGNIDIKAVLCGFRVLMSGFAAGCISFPIFRPPACGLYVFCIAILISYKKICIWW